MLEGRGQTPIKKRLSRADKIAAMSGMVVGGVRLGEILSEDEMVKLWEQKAKNRRTAAWRARRPEHRQRKREVEIEWRVKARKRDFGQRIYVAVNPVYAGFVKIGKTVANPNYRLSSFNVADPLKRFSYAIVVDVEDAGAAESQIHQTLKEFRVREDGEWFKVPVDVAVRLAESLRKRSSNENDDVNS